VRGWNPGSVQVASDLRQRLARAMRCLDLLDRLSRNSGGPARSGRGVRLSFRWMSPLSDQSLEFVCWNQPRAPWHVDGLDERQHSRGEGRATDAERLGGLCARVREPLDAGGPAHDGERGGLDLGETRLLSASLSPRLSR
jgi:hypothetical protein